MAYLFSSCLGCHPWSLSVLISQGRTVMGLRELGRKCQQMSCPWAIRACSPLRGGCQVALVMSDSVTLWTVAHQACDLHIQADLQ